MYTECRFIKANGLKCQSPALRGWAFCYFHARPRVLPPRRRRNKKEESINLPPLTHVAAFTPAINEILQGLASNAISPKRAGSLLYALQMARNDLDAVALDEGRSGPDVLCSLFPATSPLPSTTTPRTPPESRRSPPAKV
jgi:hypothetical protein